MGEALAGRPVDALRVAAGVRGAVAVENMTILGTELAIAEAIAHREIGDRARALLELDALAEAPAETMLYCRILAILELAQAHLDEGQMVDAERRLTQAENLIHEESFGGDGRTWLARTGTRLSIGFGDLESAHHWSAQIDDAFWRPSSAARVQLALGDNAGALATLDTAAPRCCPPPGRDGPRTRPLPR